MENPGTPQDVIHHANQALDQFSDLGDPNRVISEEHTLPVLGLSDIPIRELVPVVWCSVCWTFDVEAKGGTNVNVMEKQASMGAYWTGASSVCKGDHPVRATAHPPVNEG